MSSLWTIDLLEPILAFLGFVITIISIVYAFTRRWFRLVTEEDVVDRVDDSATPISNRLDQVVVQVEENQQRIDDLNALVEGGDSELQKGMMDFLEENIKQTNEIKSELEAIRDDIRKTNQENN